mmetsp:Transcript_20044/g.29306  ORF Transcript_20044/g.29306 Transcript_20044/m.29306 type:complete len:127 (-) Transcript_20044:134-514(-)
MKPSHHPAKPLPGHPVWNHRHHFYQPMLQHCRALTPQKKLIYGNRARTCNWIERNQKDVGCSKPSVASHCPNTCGKCAEFRCTDSQRRFKVGKHKRRCGWVASNVEFRCAKRGVLSTCRETCGACA